MCYYDNKQPSYYLTPVPMAGFSALIITYESDYFLPSFEY